MVTEVDLTRKLRLATKASCSKKFNARGTAWSTPAFRQLARFGATKGDMAQPPCSCVMTVRSCLVPVVFSGVWGYFI